MVIILTTVAAATAATGAWKGAEAVGNTNKAYALDQEARQTYKDAENALDSAREKTQQQLVHLGETKLRAWDAQIGRFVKLYEQLRNVESGNGPGDGGELQPPGEDELSKMKKVALQAQDLVLGGLSGVGAGALAGLAAYGGAMTFASASTGTAIAALSGAAAKSATLAWFGGGALTAGGMGMAGGVVVLGGLVAGPVLAVGGLVLASKARENVAKAKKNKVKAKKAAQEMKTARTLVYGIRDAAKDFDEAVEQMGQKMDGALDQLANLIQNRGRDYSAFNTEQRHIVFLSVRCAEVMKRLLEKPLLTEEGALSKEAMTVLGESRRFLEDPAVDIASA